MKPNSRSPNQVLDDLSQADFDLIRPYLQEIQLKDQSVLARMGDTLTHVYFPYVGAISLVVRLAEGETVEAAMVGRDSVFGGAGALDHGRALTEAVVQIEGSASVIETLHLRKAAEQSETLREMLVRHEQALLGQALQAAACNATHTVDARLSRWLLRARDLAGDDELKLTQEFLGQMLGVRRSSVSLVANTLQQAGLITYKRGRIRMMNIDALKETACECYESIKLHYERLRLES